MTRAIGRSIAIAAATLAVGGVLDLVYLTAFCPGHLAAERLARDPSAIVVDSGYRFARAGDAIYLCTYPERFGPFTLHDDVTCVCAARTLGANAVGQHVNGHCVVDKAEPTWADAFGACRYAHCTILVGP